MGKYLFRNCRYLISQPGKVIENGGLYIEGPSIRRIGPSDEIEAQYGDQENVESLDARHKLVLPGLVDAHNHVGEAHSLLIFGWLDKPTRGIVDATHQVYWPAHAWLDENSVYDLTMLGLINLIKHGATTHANAMPFPDVAYKASVEARVRTVIHPQIVTSVQLSDASDERQHLAQTEVAIQDYHNAHDGLIQVGVHPNAIYNCTSSLLLRGMALAQEYGVQFATHIAESLDEKDRLDQVWADEGGLIEHLRKMGLLGPQTLLFHGTLLQEGEIDVLAETDTALVHCPLTNAMFGHCAYLPYMLKCGLKVGLGTDCVTHNLFNVLLSVWQHHNILPRRLKGVDAWALFELATVGGARALGLEDRIGTLEPGKRADVIAIDLSHNTSLFPLSPEVLPSMLAMNSAGTEVSDVMVEGIFLRRDGLFTSLDEEAIIARAQARCEQFAADYLAAKRKAKPMFRLVHEEFTRS